ncbi:MAG: DNA-binding protein WhiA [Eubacteriales bacterium]
MSFSGEVKQELARMIPEARHCQIAELSAILSICGRVIISENEEYKLKVRTENISVARKCFTLIKKTFNMNTDISINRNISRKISVYEVVVSDHEKAIRILQATKILDECGEIREELSVVRNILVQQPCCKRAFIRGAFLASGSMSNPNKSYHFEIVCATEDKAKQLVSIINSFDMDAKMVVRKKHYVVYLKEGAQIVDVLNIMEAHVALMELENVRILKDMRNTVNRKVNCETANINKTVSAAVKQVNDIEYIQDAIGLEELSEGLREVAELRLEYRDLPLKELGELLSVPVGKSGVNHRLRKLGEIADKLRESQEEHYD